MDERHLLLLGLLMSQSRHGYQINEFIDNNLGRVSSMKRATAYALLERLERRGLVMHTTETVGNHPPRKVYSITEAGRRRFIELLRTLLVQAEQHTASTHIALMFLDYLPPDEALDLLDKRRSELEGQVHAIEQTPKHGNGTGVDLAIQRRLAIMRADWHWLEQTIHRLSKSTGSEDARLTKHEGDDKE